MIFLFTVSLPSALSLYWLVGGLVAYGQQTLALREDAEEMEAIADKPNSKKDVSKIQEAEVVAEPASDKVPNKTPKPHRKKSTKKRRKK